MDEKILMEKLALMERELSTLRASSKEPKFDQTAFLTGLVNDPMSALKQLGAKNEQLEHLQRVFVASAMGDQAPPQLKMLAALGPQISQQHALDAKLEALSRQFSDFMAAQTNRSVGESLKTLAVDKVKYPHLSKAYAANPSLYDAEIAGHKGTAEELATKLETQAAAFAKAYGVSTPTASDNAGNEKAQSTQSQPAGAGMDPTPPPISKQNNNGAFTEDDHAKLRDELVRKYSSQEQPK